MSDISLLMTGTFTLGLTSMADLSQPPEIQPDIGVHHSATDTLISKVGIIPPEFMPLGGETLTLLSNVPTEYQNTLKKSRKKALAERFLDSAKSNIFPAVQNVDEQQRITGQVSTEMADVISQQLTNLTPQTLRFGNSGVSVRVLQRLLLSNGYAVRVDGVFGALTEVAVKAFQDQRKIKTDGVVGPLTWNELTK